MAPLIVALPRLVRCCGVPLIVTALLGLLALGMPSAHARAHRLYHTLPAW